MWEETAEDLGRKRRTAHAQNQETLDASLVHFSGKGDNFRNGSTRALRKVQPAHTPLDLFTGLGIIRPQGGIVRPKPAAKLNSFHLVGLLGGQFCKRAELRDGGYTALFDRVEKLTEGLTEGLDAFILELLSDDIHGNALGFQLGDLPVGFIQVLGNRNLGLAMILDGQ